MSGAPRKTAAKKAASRPAPAKPAAAPDVEQVERFDLLDILAVDKPPTPITIFGIDADVRSDFTGLEVVEYQKLLGANKIHDVLVMIIGEDAADQLWEKVEDLLPASTAKILNRIIQLSGLDSGGSSGALAYLATGDGWGTSFAGFHQRYQLDLRVALRQMPWRDLVALLDRMHELDAQDARDSENLAMLVDRDDFWLRSEYASWITDPDDPEVKAARALRKRSGQKPPASPPLRPVALRPPELHDQRTEQYEALANPPTPDVPTAKMSARDFAALVGR